ncbi:hypothetical protein BDA99DRAFT_564392 [Phascolomyces articulosus]|uniref:Protein JTB n=1 Tax=Phascolomyces articulosus TaxID=60185 RepID=A0AAD5JQ66_9FUNG|nr:hypothetical protein BDA99DRAFT_564392 [Phascolomyces articulosus]
MTRSCHANTHGFQKRAPPFTQGGDESIPHHLGNYTHSHEDVAEPTYSCTSIGECDVCTPFEQKSAPYCKEYGNKERVRCEWDDPDLAENLRNQTMVYDYDAISLPSYRGCPHVKRIEHWKFIKFETFNLLVAVTSVSIVLWRQRKLARDQYQRLAQRIGVAV